MRIESTLPEQAASELESAVFRVRLWFDPRQPGAAWQLDELDVYDARDVTEVIQWARSRGASAFEVGVRWPYRRLDVDRNLTEEFRYTRVAGEPGDAGGAVRVELFSADE